MILAKVRKSHQAPEGGNNKKFGRRKDSGRFLIGIDILQGRLPLCLMANQTRKETRASF